jgi:hypothetical protein
VKDLTGQDTISARFMRAERDKKLPERLRGELPGILAWVVRGCIEWHREGLRAPDEVRRATGEYRAEMDVLAGFISDCCVVEASAWVRSRICMRLISIGVASRARGRRASSAWATTSRSVVMSPTGVPATSL